MIGIDRSGAQRVSLVKGIIESEFSGMMGCQKHTRSFSVGLDTPLFADIEAVNGMSRREAYRATAVYVTMGGVCLRYNGIKWVQA